MFQFRFITILTVFAAAGCATLTPLPSPESVVPPTPVPTEIPMEEKPMTPDVLLEITNDPDSMKDPYGVAVNSSGNIYISDAGNSRVLVFDPAGVLLAAWDQKGSGEGQFNSMGFGGLAIDSSDNVFVVDNGNHRIQKFDKDGAFLLQWGSEGTGDGRFVRAIGIAVDADGNVYVTDDGNPFVQKFDNNGNFLMKFGGAGTGDGQFSHATGIAVDTSGNIFVADYENKRVQKFDNAGNFLVTWKIGGDIETEGIPEAIAVDAQGNVYVSDYQLGRMQVFDNEGNFLWAWGEKSFTKSLFKRPTGIAFDGSGLIYIVNQSGNSVQGFNLP
jgi:DNA-binding beta-propeller fold protein YncE